MDDFPLLHAANTLERLVEQIEQASSLDPVPPIAARDVVAQAIPNGPTKDLLSGTWLGHPAAPDAHRPADRLLDLRVRARHRRRQAVTAGGRAPGRPRGARARCRRRPAAPPTGPIPAVVRVASVSSTPPRTPPRSRCTRGRGSARRQQPARPRCRARFPRGDRGDRRRFPRRAPARTARHRSRQHRLPRRPVRLDADGRRKRACRPSRSGSRPTACRYSSSNEDDQHLRGWRRPAHTAAHRSRRVRSTTTR